MRIESLILIVAGNDRLAKEIIPIFLDVSDQNLLPLETGCRAAQVLQHGAWGESGTLEKRACLLFAVATPLFILSDRSSLYAQRLERVPRSGREWAKAFRFFRVFEIVSFSSLVALCSILPALTFE
jgi:hypothetical protein